jgi:hypothetical protein
MADLLPAILPPGRAIDLLSLSERNPAAIANFLQGEREYRRTQFDAALDHYATAVRDDSAFALAAFRGAQAATWLSRADTSLLNVALRGARYLTPTQALLAKALDGYLKGDADSAVTHLRSALLADSTLSAAWTLLGEVYARALTSEPAADSLARASLHRAERLDPDFAPTLVLLEEMALQDGDLREAKRLGTALQRAGAATTHATERDLMSRCVSDGVTAVNWSDAARRDGDAVLSAGRVLSRRLAQPACARAAFTTALESDSAKRGQRWGALMGLHGVLVATGRPREFDSLVASPAARGLPAWSLYLAAAGAGAGFEREASLASDSLWSQLGQLPSPTLWLLGAWAAHRGDTTGLRRAAAALRAIADTAPSRRNLLLARLVEARLPLIVHDTDGAIARLRTLRPSAPRREIAWQHAEGLGAERLLLAELLLARHRYAESIQVASLLDATEPVPYLLYLRSSLTTRVRAAAAMNSGALVRQFERRLRALDDASSTSRR